MDKLAKRIADQWLLRHVQAVSIRVRGPRFQKAPIMTDINKAILKVAQSNPKFAKLLKAELQKEGGPDWRTISKPLHALFRANIHEPSDFDPATASFDESKVLSKAIEAAQKVVQAKVRSVVDQLKKIEKGWGNYDTLSKNLAELVVAHARQYGGEALMDEWREGDEPEYDPMNDSRYRNATDKTAGKAEVYIDKAYRTVRVAHFIKGWGSQSELTHVFGEVDRLTKSVYETLKRHHHSGLEVLSTLAHGRANGIWVMSDIWLRDGNKPLSKEEDFFQVLTDSRLRTKPWRE